MHERLSDYRSHAVIGGGDALPSVETIEFRNVSYSYRHGQLALRGVSFTVKCGETIGVAGPSGAGKSTLVQILLRLRAPDSGRYLVNGKGADQYLAQDWARLVSFLPQQPELVAGTVADNIRFFRKATNEAVERAATMANLHDEIVSWPKGYETVLGHHSDALSGGEAQRLRLARALLTTPALLVLDEPTSALDAMSENLVQQALQTLTAQTTVFIVAHGCPHSVVAIASSY